MQVPPNLAPARDLTDCGIDDLGGVSPVTVDHINPEYEWPGLRELEAVADHAGVPLTERLPVYEQYVDDQWLSPTIRDALRADDDAGERFRACLSDPPNRQH